MIEFVAEVALEVGAELGEGPVWDDRSGELYFVDIAGHAVHAFAPATGEHRVFDVGSPVGALGLRDDGGLVLAAHDAFLTVNADGTAIAPLGEFRADGAQVRFNDGKPDPAGRFIAGTMDWAEEEPRGSLYLLHPDGRVVTLLEEVTISNGLAFSPDHSTMYYIDTPRHTVDAFDVDAATGELSRRRVVAEVRHGGPDGMAIDDEGLLWVAVWGGHRVERIDPASGEVVAVVRVEASNVTCPTFGGAGLDELYITTAWRGLDAAARAAEPHAGDLFVCRPGVTGPPPQRFSARGALG